MNATGPSNEHHAHAPNIDPLRLRLSQVPLRQCRHEVVPVLTRRVVHANPLAVYEMPAEVGCAERYGESETADHPSRSSDTTKPERERDRVEPSGREVQQPVEEAHAAIVAGGVLPVSHAGHCGADGASQPDADCSVSRAGVMSVASA
jgi:hypothetical protein